MEYVQQTDRLRPRQRDFFYGFTTGEIEKMEKSFLEFGPEETTTKEFCSKLAGKFTRSSGRARKPPLKWSEVQNWFVNRQEEWNKKRTNGHVKEDVSPLSNGKADSSNVKEYSCNAEEESAVPRVAGQTNLGFMNLKFEAKSSKDGAWYDVDLFLDHRLIDEPEVYVRYMGYGAEEDEWVKVKSIRERSIPLESSECNRLKVGDFVLCFQKKRHQEIYYDAHIKGIQRKEHDNRGCRCLFLIRYDHDNSEEKKVKLRRLCRRPTW